MFIRKSNRFQTGVTVMLIFFFVLQLVYPVLIFKTETAQAFDTAFGPGILSHDISKDVVDKTEKKAETTFSGIMDRLYKAMVLSASIAVRNAAVMLSKAAAQSAINAIAGGDRGQDPTFNTDSMLKMAQDIGTSMASSAIDSVMSEFSNMGLNFCEPQLGLKNLFSDLISVTLPKDPGLLNDRTLNCDFNTLKGNWTSLIDEIKNIYESIANDPVAFTSAFLEEQAKLAFDVKYADIGNSMTLQDKINKDVADQREAKALERVANQDSKPKTNLGGDRIETPGTVRRDVQMNQVAAAQAATTNELDTSLSVIESIPESIVASFLNSFVSVGLVAAVVQRIVGGVAGTPDQFDKKNRLSSPKEAINRQLTSSVEKVDFNVETREMSLLSDFITCPDPRGTYNCVINQELMQAVRQKMTVAEAIASGYLNPNLPFIGPDNPKDKTSGCYREGWCYSNLVKMRKARILPVGWELVASIIAEGENVTLANAISQFYEDPNILVGGEPQFPYARLIDPNWVLDAPKAMCDAVTFGNVLQSTGSADRQEVCADYKTCIDEDDTGSCKAWGYCAAEKNSFRFGGTSCQGQYDSCRTFTDRDKQSVSYLYNTVDRDGCNVGNVGCQWYSTAKYADGPEYKWLSDYQNRLHLNKKVEDLVCSPDQEGCSTLINTEAGLGTNLLPNGSFELHEDDGTMGSDSDKFTLQNWGIPKRVLVDDNVFDGSVALRIANAEDVRSANFLPIVPKNFERYFALSAYVYKYDANSRVALNLILQGNDDKVVALDELSSTEIIDGLKENWLWVYRMFKVKPLVETTGSFIDNLHLYVQLSAPGNAIALDRVMLEELASPSVVALNEYKPYASNNQTLLKVAPEYYGCYDSQDPLAHYRPVLTADINLTNDAARCKTDFANLCTAEEVGCEGYTPADGGAVINGVAAYLDHCPQECAGYSTYFQEATYFEQSKFPVHFIPQYADKCPASDVGCEEFTNLDNLASGGESKEYYTQLRHCVDLPVDEAKCTSFYSWVASETSGYQLKTYYLEKNGTGATVKPATILDTLAPADPRLLLAENICNFDVWDSGVNPDCRQFYNENGQPFYILYSKTISCSADCHPLRKTDKYATESQCTELKGNWDSATKECTFMAITTESRTCKDVSVGCKAYQGNFAGDEEIILTENFNDAAISPSLVVKQTNGSAGAYSLVAGSKGGADRSMQMTVGELFTKKGDFNLDSGSYIIAFWAKKAAGTAPVVNTWLNIKNAGGSATRTALGSDLPMTDEWQSYQFMLNLPDSTFGKDFELEINPTNHFIIDNLKITKVTDSEFYLDNSWAAKTPNSCDQTLFDQPMNLAQLGCREYKNTAGDTHFLKSFSSLCSEDKVGCRAFIDTRNDTLPVSKDFASAVDCRQTSSSACQSDLDDAEDACQAKGYVWLGSGDSGSCQYSDRLVYLVKNEKAECNPQQLGCTALGLPEMTVNGTTGEYIAKDGGNLFSNLFIKLNPNTFEAGNPQSPLCEASEFGCEEFTTDDGSAYYFRDPGDKLCEYRDLPTSNEAWIKKTSSGALISDRCPGAKAYYKDGSIQMPRNNDVDDYQGWTGACPETANLCTAFVDPTDVIVGTGSTPAVILAPGGKATPSGSPTPSFGTPPKKATFGASATTIKPNAYYYLKNEDIDASSCLGTVSRKDGCVLFDDTSEEGDRAFNAFATYIESGKVSGAGVQPVSSDELTELEDAITTYLPGGVTENYQVCREMIGCLAREKTIADCLAEVSTTDLDPVAANIQFPCSAGAAVLGETFYKNALMTARDVMIKDANKVIKVIRDRECASWFSCRQSHWLFDSGSGTDGSYIEACDRIGLCDRLDYVNGGVKCANFVQQEDLPNNLMTYNEPFADPTNSTARSHFVNRGLGWYDLNYSGETIPRNVPMHFVNAIDIAYSPATAAKLYCGGTVAGGECLVDDTCSGLSCIPAVDYRLVSQDIGVCSTVADCTASGFCSSANASSCRCVNGACVKPLGATGEFDDAPTPTCRAYPEIDSPFPFSATNSTIINSYKKANQPWLDIIGLSNEMVKNYDLGCSYKKQLYGGGALTKYIPRVSFYNPNPGKAGFCQDTPTQECDCGITSSVDPTMVAIRTETMCTSSDCLDPAAPSDVRPGMCLLRSKTSELYNGWQGYCLQYDTSINLYGDENRHPCLTWYPVQTFNGLQDVQNQFLTAGYAPGDDEGNLYCSEPIGNNKNIDSISADFQTATGPINGYVEVVSGINGNGSHADLYKYSQTETVANTLPSAGVKNRAFTLSAETYGEALAYDDSHNIYWDDVVGAVIEVIDSDATDWIGPHNNGDTDGTSAVDWYRQSNRLLVESNGYNGLLSSFGLETLSDTDSPPFGGFFLPIIPPLKFQDLANQTKAVPGGAGYLGGSSTSVVGAQAGYDAANLVSRGNLGGYCFWKGQNAGINGSNACASAKTDLGSTYVGPWKDWTFYQTVWPGAPTSDSMGYSSGTYMRGSSTKPSFIFGDTNPSYGLLSDQEQAQIIAKDDDQMKKLRLLKNDDDYEDSGIEPDKYYPLFVGAGWSDVHGHNGGNDQSGDLCLSLLTDRYWADYSSDQSADFDADYVSANGNVNPCLHRSELNPQDCKDSSGNVVTCNVETHFFSNNNGCADINLDNHQDNYFGVRLLFDETGKYRGPWLSLCDGSADQGWVALNIRFIFKEYCQELIQVSKTGPNNKARTNELFKLRQQLADGTNVNIVQTAKTPDHWVTADSGVPLLGSTSSGLPETTAGQMYTPWYIPNGGDTDQYAGGSPYVTDASSYKFGGKPWECADSGDTKQCVKADTVSGQALTKVKDYFAKIFNVYEWDKVLRRFKLKSGTSSDDSASSTKYPMVFAAVERGETSAGGSKTHVPKPNSIAVDGKVSGDIIGHGSEEVVVKFYAWANADQMPLKKITVDWQDGTTTRNDGFYKNHKPVCSQTAAGELIGDCRKGSTTYEGFSCREDADCQKWDAAATCINKVIDFGDSQQACEESVFTFSNLYTCPSTDILNECANDADSKCWEEIIDPITLDRAGQPVLRKACRFIPKVQVTDNWGLCNGNNGAAGGQTTAICDNDATKWQRFDGYIYVFPSLYY